MNVFPQDIEQKLGFDEVRWLLTRYCQSDRGKSLAAKARPTTNFTLLNTWLYQLKEMIRLINEPNDKVSLDFPDIDDYLKRLKVAGSFIDPQDFHELKRGIYSITSWTLFFQNRGDAYPKLLALSSTSEVDPHLAVHIDRAIDDRGDIKDTASRKLSDIRTQISKSERSVRSAIQKVLKSAKEDQFSEEDSTLTVRDGRLVIPVRAEHKKRIQGFVHDESATGQTVYLEPADVLELNNQVQELKYAEKREITRILIDLSDHVRANLPALHAGADLLEKLDYIHAKALLADVLKATIPGVKDQRSICLIRANHPLLALSHRDSQKPVVPLDITLKEKNRILIISGPNAGGKSVALKTVGLLQYMIQTGLAVPVSEESEMGLFHSLFLDIGDTQSIADDLSTYSSHLTSMRHFLQHTDKRTLFLIDEFGKGTEPQFGGAIAESVLQSLNQQHAFGVVTTHYQNLKKLGDETPGLVNGAMKYDMDALEPLFELEMGKPGSSFAFEIAGKIGLPQPIIESARKKIGTSHVAYDQLLNELEREKRSFEKLNRNLEKDQTDASKLRTEYQELRDMLQEERKRILKAARAEAGQILQGANKEVERAIREIKESKAAKSHTQQVRQKLEEKKQRLKEKPAPSKKRWNEGDVVRVIGQESAGTIQKIKGRQAEVLFGAIKSIVSVDKLEAANQSPKVSYQKKVKSMGIDLSSKMSNFSHELTIRGMRAEEAIEKVESFIDESLLVGVDEVRIVHGKGHGVLRDLVRNIAKSHTHVARVSDEHADRGGSGISILQLQ